MQKLKHVSYKQNQLFQASLETCVLHPLVLQVKKNPGQQVARKLAIWLASLMYVHMLKPYVH